MNSLPVSRREIIKLLGVAGAASACPARIRAGAVHPAGAPAVDMITRYLETLARPDGGYGWDDLEISHLTPTFGVIGSYRLLGRTPPRKEALTAYVRTHHPQHIKKLEQERRVFDFQQLQALVWLEADVSEFRGKFSAWTKPVVYLKQYERHGYPVMQSELGAVFGHRLLELPVTGLAEAFTRYIGERQRANGSFNNTPAADGGDGHVMNTLWALQALAVLGRELTKKDELVAWLRACQLKDGGGKGGFTFAAKPEFGGVDDIAYTRAALRALKLAGGAPADREACIRYIHSLANSDGGFGDRPGWFSNATATFYALDALDALGAMDTLDRVRRRPSAAPAAKLPAGLKVFTIQIESHGQGSPADAVELARGLRISLWGAKNAKPGWLARAQAIAAQKKVLVTFFPANEEYGTWVNVPGLGTYSHTSDMMAPPTGDVGASLANKGVVTWPEFRERRLNPLQRGGGRLIWQFGENEELVRMFLDDSVERGGFAAISTFHFGNPDFTNTEPFLKRWRGRIPYIALQDAHGPDPWWFADTTTAFRTLFLATEPTWDGWLNALKQNWVAAVRRDVCTRGKTWMHAGSPEVLAFVRAHARDWQWWDNPAIQRPMVSMVALTPADELEAGRPDRGVVLRVRCAWENTAQGLAKQPLAEFVKVLLDGRETPAELVARKRGPTSYEDYHHRVALPDITAGTHRATAVVRVLETKAEVSQNIEFVV